MRSGKAIALSAALALTAGALLFGATGCGGDASSDNSATVGKLASADGAGDLTGTWVLNKDLSDKPQRPDSGHGFDRPDGPPPDSGRGWRRHGGPPDSARWARMRDSIPDSLRGFGPGHGPRGMRGPMTMTIAQTDSTVDITGPRGRTRTLYTDGRVMTPQHDRAPEGVEIRAIWNTEGQLVVTHVGPKGGTRTETFALSADGEQLIITTHVDPAGDRPERDFRRVFDAASASN